MHSKPTLPQIQQILQKIGIDLIDSFRYRLKDGSMNSINDFKQRFISETVISVFAADKIDSLRYGEEGKKIYFYFFDVVQGKMYFKDASALSEHELKSLNLKEASDIETTRKKANELQNDLNFLYKETVEAVTPKLEKIYAQVRMFDSVLKYSKYCAIGLAAISLVPLLLASKSNRSLPYFVCSTALLCLSGATLAVRNYLGKDISKIIYNNIKVNFSEPTLESTLLNSLDASPKTVR